MKTNSTILFSILLLLLALPALAQTESQYSDKDKKKMAEIAQRPEVQAKIAQTWADVQRREMQYAYNVNSASHRGEMEITDEFRQQYGQLYDNPIL